MGKWKGKKRKKNNQNQNKLCPLHDADLEVGGKWKNQVEGRARKVAHDLPESQKNQTSKGGAGKSFEPFGLLLRLSMPFIEKALQRTRSDWSAPARRPANLTDKYCTHVI